MIKGVGKSHFTLLAYFEHNQRIRINDSLSSSWVDGPTCIQFCHIPMVPFFFFFFHVSSANNCGIAMQSMAIERLSSGVYTPTLHLLNRADYL